MLRLLPGDANFVQGADSLCGEGIRDGAFHSPQSPRLQSAGGSCNRVVSDILNSELKDKNRCCWFLRVSGDNGMCAMVSVSCRIAAAAAVIQSHPIQADQLQFQKMESALDSAGTGAAVCILSAASLSSSRSQ